MPHLFVDISAHGFGHLSQAAPVLNTLAEIVPDLRLTIRSGLPVERLQLRIVPPFTHLPAASDFGYVMHDAVRINLPATAAAYRAAHADFPARIAAEAELLKTLQPDAVFSNVAYLPLAGAARAGIPACALCSLNWADLFDHYFGNEPWAAPIHAEMLAAYRGATFLRTTPGMPMKALENQMTVGPIATPGRERREELRTKVGAGDTAPIVLVALGGIPTRLPVEQWPVNGTHYIVPAAWQCTRPDFYTIESFGWPFVDLLRSVDAIIAKPGYGTFAEAAANGTAVIYQRRDDWPEQDCLIEWLQQHARCTEVTETELAAGEFGRKLENLRSAAVPPAGRPSGRKRPEEAAPTFDGAAQAARHLAALLA
jgi:hypothetical protein